MWVSACFFFWHACRSSQPGDTICLVHYDQHGDRLGLPAGLSDLPLHPDQDGWHSVLGTWNGTMNNLETADNRGSDIALPIAPINSVSNARPPQNILCHYHKCTGHRLAAPFRTTLYLGSNLWLEWCDAPKSVVATYISISLGPNHSF